MDVKNYTSGATLGGNKILFSESALRWHHHEGRVEDILHALHGADWLSAGVTL